MSDGRENAICSCICIYNIFEKKKKSNAVSSLHRLCIASTSCYRSYIATRKLKKYDKKKNTKTFDGKQKSLVMRKSAFCNCAADQRLCFRYTDCTIPLIHKSKCQAFSHLLWLYSSVCVGLVRKPRRPVFSQRGSNTGSIFFNDMRP